MTVGIDLLALDVEGTLVSNAVSRVPRPGLHAFLDFCRGAFPRVVVYTGVDERRFRELAAQLVRDGAAPAWFAAVEHVAWNGPHKLLSAIPGGMAATTLLVDDMPACVAPAEVARWVRVVPFEPPFPSSDTELARVQAVLADHLAGRPPHSDPNPGGTP